MNAIEVGLMQMEVTIDVEYLVQVIDSESDHTILTSVEACQVRRANFRYVISHTMMLA